MSGLYGTAVQCFAGDLGRQRHDGTSGVEGVVADSEKTKGNIGAVDLLFMATFMTFGLGRCLAWQWGFARDHR